METSEWIAWELFKCFDCSRWLPLSQAARDIRQDEETVAGIQCDDCVVSLEADHVEVA